MLTATSGQVSKSASSRMRWAICAVLFWVTTANYIDRSVFGNLAPALAASGHQAWSANVLTPGDMFPRLFVGSVCGFAGMVSYLGSMALFYISGRVLSVTGNYIPIFILASVAYSLGLLIIQLLAPRLDPADIDVEKTLRKQLRRVATLHGSPITWFFAAFPVLLC